jgi:hypothetical protein
VSAGRLPAAVCWLMPTLMPATERRDKLSAVVTQHNMVSEILSPYVKKLQTQVTELEARIRLEMELRAPLRQVGRLASCPGLHRADLATLRDSHVTCVRSWAWGVQGSTRAGAGISGRVISAVPTSATDRPGSGGTGGHKRGSEQSASSEDGDRAKRSR